MRIALTANGQSPHTQRWANALSSRGHEVTVVWEAGHVVEAALARFDQSVRHIARRPSARIWRSSTCPIQQASVAELRGLIRPDLVQAMYLAGYGWRAARFGRPVVQFALGSDVLVLGANHVLTSLTGLRTASRRARTINALRTADLVFCDSQSIAETLRAHAGGTRVEIIRIGVELQDDSSSGRDWRQELHISSDAFVLLSTRVFGPNYNIDTIIRAFAHVAGSIAGATLVLKEFEPLSDPGYRMRCEKLVDELKLTDRTRWVGELDRPDLLALYRAADVFISVPSADATAVSVLEAMAASLPVIATRTAGLDPDVLRDGETALLVEPRDAGELAEAVQRIHDRPGLRAVLAEAARTKVRAVGDLDREMDRVERLYSEVARLQ